MKSYKQKYLILVLVFLLSAALAGCNNGQETTEEATTEAPTPQVYTAPDWFTDRGNLGHIASMNSQIILPLTERWQVNLGGGVRSSVIGSFGKLFVGADDNTMYALSPQDGSVQWAFEAEGKISSTATAMGMSKDGVCKC